MRIILGIDPGLGGALAALSAMGKLVIVDAPTVEVKRGGKGKREIDPAALADIIREMKPTHAVVEKVGAMPGQGVSSMFSFGRSVGQVEGALAALGIPVSYVSPLTWKRSLSVPAGKDGARLRASQLLPAYAERWRLVKHDGRAEAGLIALWGLLNVPALVEDAK
jgi:crossover junction endodeoxyribonuclease RuvC